MAKERGQLAAVALNIAKPSSADARRANAKPKRPSSAEDAASKGQREGRQAGAEGRVLDSRRARERAEAARAALGIGGRKPAPPRRASQHDADAKAQAPRRPSARAVSPAGAGLNARGGGGGDRSPAGGGAEGVAQAGRREREGGKGAGGGRGGGAGGRAGGVVGSNLGIEMDAALELARRRRAARAVFGLGGGDEDELNAPPVLQLEDKQGSNLEVKSSRPDRPAPDNVVATPSPSRRAEAKPLVPTPPRGPSVDPEERRLPSGSKQATDRHHDDNRLGNRTPAPAATEEGDSRGSKQEMGPVGEDAGDVALPADGCRRRGQAQEQQEQQEAVSMAGPPIAPPLQAEQKGSSYDDCCDASFEGRGGGGNGDGRVVGGRIGDSAATVAAAEKERKAGESCRDDAGGQQEENPAAGRRSFSRDIPSEVGVEVADDDRGGDCEVRSKVDLGVEDGWFEKLEAKMGAIKKQVRVGVCLCCRFVGVCWATAVAGGVVNHLDWTWVTVGRIIFFLTIRKNGRR